MLPARFFSKVNKTDTCWLWTAALDVNGYGVFWLRGRTDFAHRIAYEDHYGAVAAGGVVRHKCDVPACVNPKHLLCGTHADNVYDCISRSRSATGEKNGRAKLRASDVAKIRVRRAAGETATSIAKSYGVDRTLVRLIMTNQIWKV